MLDAGLIGAPIAPGRYATSKFAGTGDGRLSSYSTSGG